MSYFKAKMHQIPFGLGLSFRPIWAGSLSTPLDPLVGFKGAVLLREGRGGAYF